MNNQNQLEEIRIAIESKLKDLQELVQEYHDEGGDVNTVTMLNFADDDMVRGHIVGNSSDIFAMVMSNDDLTEIIRKNIMNSNISEILKDL